MDRNTRFRNHPQRLHISVVSEDTTRVVSLAGALDRASAEDCASALLDGDEPAVTLDLSAMTFMDSSGYHVITECRRRLRQERRGSLTVRGAVGQPARLLQLIAELQREPTGVGRLTSGGRCLR